MILSGRSLCFQTVRRQQPWSASVNVESSRVCVVEVLCQLSSLTEKGLTLILKQTLCGMSGREDS